MAGGGILFGSKSQNYFPQRLWSGLLFSGSRCKTTDIMNSGTRKSVRENPDRKKGTQWIEIATKFSGVFFWGGEVQALPLYVPFLTKPKFSVLEMFHGTVAMFGKLQISKHMQSPKWQINFPPTKYTSSTRTLVRKYQLSVAAKQWKLKCSLWYQRKQDRDLDFGWLVCSQTYASECECDRRHNVPFGHPWCGCDHGLCQSVCACHSQLWRPAKFSMSPSETATGAQLTAIICEKGCLSCRTRFIFSSFTKLSNMELVCDLLPLFEESLILCTKGMSPVVFPWIIQSCLLK